MKQHKPDLSIAFEKFFQVPLAAVGGNVANVETLSGHLPCQVFGELDQKMEFIVENLLRRLITSDCGAVEKRDNEEAKRAGETMQLSFRDRARNTIKKRFLILI